jgi:hypothetical protein
LFIGRRFFARLLPILKTMNYQVDFRRSSILYT